MGIEEQPGDLGSKEVASARNEIEAFPVSRIKTIDRCDFPIVESEVKGYKVLVLPPSLKHFFDEEGYEAIRINSAELVTKLPVYGGKTAGTYSYLPHQDHLASDPRRFLALSKPNADRRDSMTYLVRPEVVQKALPKILSYFYAHRDSIRELFVYDLASQVSEEELLSCFEPGGINRLAGKITGKDADPKTKLFAYTGILTYLIQGRYAEEAVREFLKDNEKEVATEEWKTSGVLIIDNSKVFHGRFGNNENSLQRNWLVTG